MTELHASRREALKAIGLAGALWGTPVAAEPVGPPRVLLVVAHPDDEYYFAATTYRIAHELGGVVDQVVITNGEGGYRYSTLAEKIYGVALTDEATGRSKLPGIRRRETLEAGKVLGIRRHYFLGQRDARFTLDAGEALDGIWQCSRIRTVLRKLLERGQYDYVFTLLPRAETHGHHQAATLLTLEVVESLPPGTRKPLVLGAEPQSRARLEAYHGLRQLPLTQPASERPVLSFDRKSSLGFRGALRYEMVVHWVICAHKSQGLFQDDVGKHDLELFWLLGRPAADAAPRLAAFQQLLSSTVRPALTARQGETQ